MKKDEEISKEKLVWKYLHEKDEKEIEGSAESPQQIYDNIADMVLERDEMELQVWCQDEKTSNFVGVTRPVLWQDFVIDHWQSTKTVDLYNKDNQIEKIGTLTFQWLFKVPVNLPSTRIKP